MWRHAFTLIEFVLVIAIISILAVSAVAYFSFDSTRLVFAQEKLAHDLRLAKSLAVMKGATFGVFFEPQAERYTVFMGTPAVPIADPANPTQSLIVDYTFKESTLYGVSLVSADFDGTTTVTFDARGIPYNGNGTLLTSGVGGSGTVMLGIESLTESVTVNAETGKVSTP